MNEYKQCFKIVCVVLFFMFACHMFHVKHQEALEFQNAQYRKIEIMLDSMAGL